MTPRGASVKLRRTVGGIARKGLSSGGGGSRARRWRKIEDRIVDFVQYSYDLIEWPGVVVMMAIESAAVPLPSEIIMPLAGWFLIEDRGLGIEWLFLAAFFGALGNLIGSWIAYGVGVWGGRPLLFRYGRYVLVSRHEIELAERWFLRWGSWAVFLSRLLPAIRTFISLPAGVARMDIRRFSLLTFVGSFPWSLGLAWAGFALGEQWERLTDWTRPAEIPIVIAVVLLVVVYVYRRAKTVWGQPEPSVPEGGSDSCES